jgi:hypothetical protein
MLHTGLLSRHHLRRWRETFADGSSDRIEGFGYLQQHLSL